MYGRDAVDATRILTTTSTYITRVIHACILYGVQSTTEERNRGNSKCQDRWTTELRQITGSKAYSEIHITSSPIMLAAEYIHTCIVKVVKPEKKEKKKRTKKMKRRKEKKRNPSLNPKKKIQSSNATQMIICSNTQIKTIKPVHRCKFRCSRHCRCKRK